MNINEIKTYVKHKKGLRYKEKDDEFIIYGNIYTLFVDYSKWTISKIIFLFKKLIYFCKKFKTIKI